MSFMSQADIFAITGKDLNDAVDEMTRTYGSRAEFIDITISGFECMLAYGSDIHRMLYFMIENIRYCYEVFGDYHISEPERGVIESSENLINSRYRL